MSPAESGSSAGRAKALFLDALELETAERTVFLQRLARTEPALAERVAGLLRAHDGDAADSLESMGTELRHLLREAIVEPGTVVGDYELLDEIASGASGVVWRARQRSLDRVVALKVLRSGQLAGRREVERFHREAEAVARIQHPNVVPVYEVGEHEGRHFFSMRFLEGGSLAERVGPDRRWSPEEAAALVRKLARAVHHAHQRGLLHRDIKPSNVLLDGDGVPSVADFGVAARIDEAGVAAVTSTLAGTPAYMAPEQSVLGEGSGSELTVATDVWALGCLLYELLGGRPPFEAESVRAVLAKVRDEDPFPLRALAPSVPRDLETITLRCLQKDPARRYASANALAVDLGRWLDHEPILARRAGPLERAVLAWRRNPVVASLVFLVLALMTTLAIGGLWAGAKLEERLRDSLLREARATRLSEERGRRARALDLLREAHDLRPGPDLRDEAIACLALTDVAITRTEAHPVGFRGDASPDGDLRRVAFSDRAGGSAIVVEDVQLGRELLRIPHEGSCHGVVMSRDGSRVAFKLAVREPGGNAVETRVHDVDSGEQLFAIDREWTGRGAALDPRGRLLALGDASGLVSVHAVDTGEELLRLQVDDWVGGMLIQEDGGALVVAYGNASEGAVELYGLPDGDLRLQLPLQSRPFVLAWMQEERGVVVGLGDYSARMLPFEGDARELVLSGHRAEVVLVSAPPGLPLIVTSSWDRSFRLWDASSGEEIMRAEGSHIGVSADGRRLLFRSSSAFVFGELVHGTVLRVLHGHSGKAPGAPRFSSDGRLLVTYGTDGAILWETDSGRRVGRLSRTRVDLAEFTPDGRHLFLAGPGGLERRAVADPLVPGELLASEPRQMGGLTRDGSLLVVRDRTTLELRDSEDGRLRGTIEGYVGLEHVTVGATGRYVAGNTWQGRGVSVWRVEDGALLGRLAETQSSIGTLISPDETRLVVCDGFDYHVYSLPELDEVHVIDRGLDVRSSPATMAYTPDGALLAVGLGIDTLALYSTDTYEEVARLESRTATFDRRAEFSPDGQTLAIVTANNRAYLWDLRAVRRELDAVGVPWEADE